MSDGFLHFLNLGVVLPIYASFCKMSVKYFDPEFTCLGIGVDMKCYYITSEKKFFFLFIVHHLDNFPARDCF